MIGVEPNGWKACWVCWMGNGDGQASAPGSEGSMSASFDHRGPPASRNTGSTFCASNKPAATSFQPRKGVVRSGASAFGKDAGLRSVVKVPGGGELRPME